MQPTRRDVLTSTASFAAATLVGCAAARAAEASKPATQPATTSPAATAAATTQANTKPGLAVIGAGGIGRFHGSYLNKYVNVVAVADPDRGHAESYNKDVAGGKAFVAEDYRKVLERKDVDLVLVTTPDHWHTKITADTLRAGKDVYCEKPLTLTIDEGRFLCRVVRETSRLLQVGTQQRSERQFQTAVALCHAGRLGKIRHVIVVIGPTPGGRDFKVTPPPPELNWDMWLGQTPKVEYIPERSHNNFRWWYEYSGGRMTDWGAHHVDIAQWAIAPDLPGPSIIDPAGVELPVPFERGFPTVSNAFNTVSKFSVTCKFGNGVDMVIKDTADHFPSDNGVLIIGDGGYCFVNRERITGPAFNALKDDPLPEGALPVLPPGLPDLPHERHFINFMNAVKTRTTPNSDIFSHHTNLTTCHLANIACRVGRKLQWDASAQQIVGDEEADAFQARAQRRGYEVV